MRSRLLLAQRAPTCLALSEDERWIFTGGKDCSIIHWDVETGKRLAVMKGRKVPAHEVDETTVTTHTDEVLAVAASTDGRYLVSGGRDRSVHAHRASRWHRSPAAGQ